MRWTFATVTTAGLALAASSRARADVLPSPGRPEWDDTPLPMPDGPPDVVILLVLCGLLFVAGFTLLRMRRQGLS